MHTTDPFASGVLHPLHHQRLVADITNVARDASIQPEWLYTALADTCSAEEVEWVRRFKLHSSEGVHGLCLVGKNPTPDIETRMAAIAGALVRNFIRTRVVTLNDFMTFIEEGSEIADISCLCIPNFFSEKAKSGGTPAWKVDNLLDGLLHRRVRGLSTIIYVPSLNEMGLEYGQAMRNHISTHFQTITV